MDGPQSLTAEAPAAVEPPLADLAAAIRVTRKTFRALYDRQAALHGPAARSFMILNVATAEDRAAFLHAFRQAEDQGWLSALVIAATEAGFFEEGTERESRIRLQQTINAIAGFAIPELASAGALRAQRRVCHIIISGSASTSGSGFLVGPQTVVTAWHVVRDLLDDTTGQPLAGSNRNISVIFDDLTTVRAGDEPLLRSRFGVRPDWLVACSRCHPAELAGAWPDPLSLLDDHFDFAVIRLDGTPGLERGYEPLDAARWPEAEDYFFVFQHPDRLAQRMTVTTETAFLDDTGRWRFTHNANAEGGSSGGLCTNGRFEVVALHQASVGKRRNAAIPTAHIAPLAGDVTTVDVESTSLDQLGQGGQAVLGRKPFQALVWQAVRGASRILTVNLPPKEGNSFTAEIIRALVPIGQNIVVTLSSFDFPTESTTLADLVLNQIQGGRLGAMPAPTTTDVAWSKNVLFPHFAELFASGARDRLVWLVLDDLNKQPLPDTSARRFLEVIYQNILALPSLRVVLLEHGPSVSGADPSLVASEPASGPGSESIVATYLMRRHEGAGLDQGAADLLAKVVVQSARRSPGSQLASLARELAETVDLVMPRRP